MNLTTVNNQFYFSLPSDFIPEGYEERYMKLLGNRRKVYSTVLDYLNSTIQTITYPAIKFPTVSNPQIIKRKVIKWKTVGNIFDLFDPTVTVTFLNVDGNLNFLIMQDILVNHYLNVERPYDKPLLITVLDQNRNAMYHIQYRSLIWTGISDNTFAFNDQVIQNKTFTMTFEYGYIDYEYVADKRDIITGGKYDEPLNTQPSQE